MAKYNFDDIAEDALLPKGQYNLEILEAEAEESGNGNPMVKLTLQVIDHEEHSEFKLWHNLTLTEKAMKMVKTFMAALGVTGDQLNEFDFEEDVEDLVGAELQAFVSIKKSKEYGEQNVIRKPKPIDS